MGLELFKFYSISGEAGRVHISNRTLDHLNGQFEVEPGEGDSREEKLKQAGIKTFFITKVLVPVRCCLYS